MFSRKFSGTWRIYGVKDGHFIHTCEQVRKGLISSTPRNSKLAHSMPPPLKSSPDTDIWVFSASLRHLLISQCLNMFNVSSNIPKGNKFLHMNLNFNLPTINKMAKQPCVQLSRVPRCFRKLMSLGRSWPPSRMKLVHLITPEDPQSILTSKSTNGCK